MRIVFAHICYQEHAENWYRAVADAAPGSLEVVAFPLNLGGHHGRLSWEDLDHRWRYRDRKLIQLYKELMDACAGADVLWNYNGAMLHPEFIKSLPCRTVYSCFDDPEDFPDLVEPVAEAYDYALYGNAASGALYSAHFKQADWIPIFTDTGEFDYATETPDFDNRDIDLVFAGGVSHHSDYRRQRLLHLTEAFPEAVCVGRGWPRGYVARSEIEALYRRARIGWNVHRTTGPINQRLFDLARFGVAQVCDNAPHLGRVFELEKEILGFGPIEEAVRQIKRLLDDDDLRRSIAVAARQRYEADYCSSRIWECFAQRVKANLPQSSPFISIPSLPAPGWLSYQHSSRWERLKESARRGVQAVREGWRTSPRYRSWDFSESAYLPDRFDIGAASPEIPPTVLDALASLLPQRTMAVSDDDLLDALTRSSATALQPDSPDASGPLVHITRSGIERSVGFALDYRESEMIGAYIIAYGDPSTLDSFFRATSAWAANDRAESLLFRTCVVTREHVPWAEVLDTRHSGKPCWTLFEIKAK